MALLDEIFPVTPDPTLGLNFGEPAGPRDVGTYEAEHANLFQPIRRLFTQVREQDGQPVGVLMAFVRELAHVVDGILYLGYLWPLWDQKRQTFADKICPTVVLDDRVVTSLPSR